MDRQQVPSRRGTGAATGATRGATRARGRGSGSVRGSRRQARIEEEDAVGSSSSSEKETESEMEEDEEQESQGPETSPPRRVMGSMPLVPRTEHVDEKLRKKIRQGKFVDFKLLIPHTKGNRPRTRFSLEEGLFQEVEDDTTQNFYQWLDAYIVFMSVNLEFFPAEAQGMLRHMQVIKRMHTANKDGVEYDYLFRKLKSNNADIAWGEYLAELAGEVKEMTPRKRFKPSLSKGQTRYKTQGLCYRFNSQEGCRFGSRCRYAHKCKRCSSTDHPEYRCSKK